MSATAEETAAVVRRRLERAYGTLEELNHAVQGGYWYDAANRMYYACYHAVSALMSHEGLYPRTHSGIAALLGDRFIRTGRLPRDLGVFYSRALELRQGSDYSDWREITEADILPMMPHVRGFIDAIAVLVNQDKVVQATERSDLTP